MTDLSIEFCGVKAPNPFWLASGPPTNSEYQVRRAFDAGWGGAVWKTLADEPIVNVSSRYGAIDYDGRKVMGLNNIELITDRPLDVNLKEIARVKKAYPDRALFVSLMVESKREAWHEITKKTQDAGADGIELNFGCPHGMSERGMGSAVGQVPDYACMITEWVKEVATIPVMVKLTPNVSDVTAIGRAAVQGGADALSLINTINSIMGVDLDTLAPKPAVARFRQPRRLLRAGRQADRAQHGGRHRGRSGDQRSRSAASAASRPGKTPSSSCSWAPARCRSARPSCTTGSGSSSICTSGLEGWMREKGYRTIADFAGRSVPRIKTWGELDLNYKVVARIDQEKCIHCGLCYIACEDGCHQSIRWDRVSAADYLASRARADGVTRSGGHVVVPGAGGDVINLFTIKEDTCVGCNMCSLVCPVEGCITMREVDTGQPPMTWNQYQARLRPSSRSSRRRMFERGQSRRIADR